MSGGRPSDYTQRIGEEICNRLALGEPLRQMCRTEGFPHEGTVYRWLAKYSEFREMYCRAREYQAEHLLEEMMEIADDGRNDWMIREGESALDAEHVQRSKLRVTTRMWAMARMAPRKYGDKISHEHSSDPDKPLVLKVVGVRAVEQK